ncbi:unnamed protein product [Anisakis simplex]|uniref:Gemin6 domain-containing protein n=1 Tax=Anisakis simplex TaxID=6269 RepID=A0A0M3JVG9_ANISI|nr:unnamed protein product [Anisakis simplex]
MDWAKWDVNALFELSAKPVRLKVGKDRFMCGNVFTVDPINKSFIIVQFHQQQGHAFRICVIPSGAIEGIEMCESDENDGCKKYTAELYEWMRNLMGNIQKHSSVDRHSVQRRDALIRWLTNNGVKDVKLDEEGTVRVFDDVSIRLPYKPDDCFSDNCRVLIAVQSLIKRFDNENQQFQL